MKSTVRFGDIALLVNESIQPKNFADMKYVGLEHINPGSLSLNGFGVGSDVSSQKRVFREGDVLFGRLRPYFRKVVIAPFDGVCSTDIWVVRGKNSGDTKFIKYWMASESFIEKSTGAAEGTRMPRAQWDWVENFECGITDERARTSIGRILSEIDEKIRVNSQISETLEIIAQAIFKSWFVDFDPVHAKARGEQPAGMDEETAALFPDSFEESELGEIPAGWAVSTVGNLCQVIDCLHSKKPMLVNEGKPYLQLDAISDSGVLFFEKAAKISIEDYKKWTSRIEVQSRDLLITNVGRVGAVAIVPKDFFGAIGRNITAIRPESKKLYSSYLITALMNQSVRREISLNTDGGTVMDALNVRNIPRIRLVTATEDIQMLFANIVNPIRDNIDVLHKQNVNLAQIRDSLLPRLISGELEIPEELLK